MIFLNIVLMVILSDLDFENDEFMAVDAMNDSSAYIVAKCLIKNKKLPAKLLLLLPNKFLNLYKKLIFGNTIFVYYLG